MTVQVAVTLPDGERERIERIRRLPRFVKVPSVSRLLATLIKEGLDRLEQTPPAEARL